MTIAEETSPVQENKLIEARRKLWAVIKEIEADGELSFSGESFSGGLEDVYLVWDDHSQRLVLRLTDPTEEIFKWDLL